MYKTIKIVLLGKYSTGKTCLFNRIINDVYTEHDIPTIGASLGVKMIKIGDKTFRICLWDTAGSERYNSLLPIYTRGADVVFLCTDCDRFSYEDFIDQESKIFRIITKIDINLYHKFPRLMETGEKLYFTSSKTGEGIKELFEDLKTFLDTIKINYFPEVDNVVETTISFPEKKYGCC